MTDTFNTKKRAPKPIVLIVQKLLIGLRNPDVKAHIVFFEDVNAHIVFVKAHILPKTNYIFKRERTIKTFLEQYGTASN